jgi:hypothetical protein
MEKNHVFNFCYYEREVHVYLNMRYTEQSRFLNVARLNNFIIVKIYGMDKIGISM